MSNDIICYHLQFFLKICFIGIDERSARTRFAFGSRGVLYKIVWVSICEEETALLLRRVAAHIVWSRGLGSLRR
jgi:hypothetical protein